MAAAANFGFSSAPRQHRRNVAKQPESDPALPHGFHRWHRAVAVGPRAPQTDAGRSDLVLRAIDKPGEAMLNLRSLRLVPR